jgi:uncharacterized protein (DUF488 family)
MGRRTHNRTGGDTADHVTILTVGHSTRSLESFIRLVQAHGVTRVVDVRTIPRSRHNPHFNGDTFPDALRAAGIAYTHMRALGGLRRGSKDSPNTGWRNSGFRAYADYMQSPEFDEALNGLIEFARRDRIAIMCAEAIPWRCHRSLISDALAVRGINVEHIMTETRCDPHRITPFAKVDGTRITYPEPGN